MAITPRTPDIRTGFFNGLFDPRQPCHRKHFFFANLLLNIIVYVVAMMMMYGNGIDLTEVKVTDSDAYATVSMFAVIPFIVLYIRRARSARISYSWLWAVFGGIFCLGALSVVYPEAQTGLDAWSALISVIAYWVFLLKKPKVFEYGGQ